MESITFSSGWAKALHLPIRLSPYVISNMKLQLYHVPHSITFLTIIDLFIPLWFISSYNWHWRCHSWMVWIIEGGWTISIILFLGWFPFYYLCSCWIIVQGHTPTVIDSCCTRKQLSPANQQKNTTISIPCVTGFLVNNSPVCRAHSWRRSNQLRLTNGPKNAPVLPPLWPAARLLRNPLRVC